MDHFLQAKIRQAAFDHGWFKNFNKSGFYNDLKKNMKQWNEEGKQIEDPSNGALVGKARMYRRMERLLQDWTDDVRELHVSQL